MSKEILLSKGLVALVDDEDYERLQQHKWYAQAAPHGFYARRFVYQDSSARMVAMHREILGLSSSDPREVDHINHDTLDNRKQNLRAVTPQENALNKSVYRNNTSGVPGIYQVGKKWRAQFRRGGHLTNVGTFGSREEAVAARTKEFRNV